MIPENAYGHAKRLAFLARHLRRDDRIVEFGCGTGVMITMPLARLGYGVVGVDTDRRSIEAGRRYFELHGLPREHLSADVPAAVVATPDVVIASEVLEHLPDEELSGVLGLIRESLAPDGRLLLTVPNGYGWFELESLLWFRLGLGTLLERLGVVPRMRRLKERLVGWDAGDEFPASLSSSPHVQRFTHRSVRARLRAAGFEVTEISGSVLLAGPFSNLLFTGIRPLMRLNGWLGSRLPRLAAGFYVACRTAGVRGGGR